MLLPDCAGDNDAKHCANYGSATETDCEGKRDADPNTDADRPFAKQESDPCPAEIATEHKRVKGRWYEGEQNCCPSCMRGRASGDPKGDATNNTRRDHVAEQYIAA